MGWNALAYSMKLKDECTTLTRKLIFFTLFLQLNPSSCSLLPEPGFEVDSGLANTKIKAKQPESQTLISTTIWFCPAIARFIYIVANDYSEFAFLSDPSEVFNIKFLFGLSSKTFLRFPLNWCTKKTSILSLDAFELQISHMSFSFLCLLQHSPWMILLLQRR